MYVLFFLQNLHKLKFTCTSMFGRFSFAQMVDWYIWNLSIRIWFENPNQALLQGYKLEILKCIKWINFLTQFTLMKLFDSTSRHILLLKVNSFLSVILVSSNEPKNNKKIVRISALASKKRSNKKSSVREPK